MKVKDLLEEIEKAKKHYLGERSSHIGHRDEKTFSELDVYISMDISTEEDEAKRCYDGDYFGFQINGEGSMSLLFEGIIN